MTASLFWDEKKGNPMLGTMTKDQFEQMRQQLIVPLAVSDILFHEIRVESDMQYNLHAALSEIDPDSALLAIALCARDVAIKTKDRVSIATALEKESTNILEDYAPNWLRHNVNSPIPSHLYEEILYTVPEDLEALADLMDALRADLNEQGTAIDTLLKLLSIQARAHMEIADFVLSEIAYEKQSDQEKSEGPSFGYGSYSDKAEQTETQFGGDNIILFPGTTQ